jgi:hypothetical protein
LVFIEDEVGDYKVPVDVLWRYNQMHEHHVHRNRQNLKVSQENLGMLYEFDSIAPDGTKEVRRMRVTTLSPVGQWTEELEGRFAGSKYITYYVPKGDDKTEVHTVGEWTSPTIPPDRLKDFVKDYLDKLYEEDKESIDNFKNRTPTVEREVTAPSPTNPPTVITPQ